MARGRCEVTLCDEDAEYEGWVRERDGFGYPTGLRRRLRLCAECARLFAARDGLRLEEGP